MTFQKLSASKDAFKKRFPPKYKGLERPPWFSHLLYWTVGRLRNFSRVSSSAKPWWGIVILVFHQFTILILIQ